MLYDFSNKDSFDMQFKHFEDKNLYPQKDFVILVYAEWCGHCQQMKPLWDKECAETNRKTIVNLDSDVMKHLIESKKSHQFSNFISENVQGYPTLMKIVNKKTHLFDGKRDSKSLNEFINNKDSEISRIVKKYAHK